MRSLLFIGLLASLVHPSTLQVGKVQLSFGDAWNAQSSVVTDCTSTFSTVTNTFNVGYGGKNVAYGLNAGAGGMVTSVLMSGFPGHSNLEGSNQTQVGAGRGDQGAANEAATQNKYNPTQGGEKKTACAPVPLTVTAHGYDIGRFNVPLFMQSDFDFVQCEDSVADQNASDGGNTDTDGIAETCPGEDSELRSEFDFQQHCEDRSGIWHLPVEQCDYMWIYARPLSARLQFGASAVDSDGNAVLDPTKYITDISHTQAGNQTTTFNDLSAPLFPWSARFNATYFTTALWQDLNGTWHSLDALQTTGGNGNAGQFNYIIGTNDCTYTYVGGGSPCKSGTVWDTSGVLNDMMCMTTGTDPNTALGECWWWPHDNYFNQYQTGVANISTMQTTYEDRRFESVFRIWPEQTSDAGTYPKLVMMPFTSGLRAPSGNTRQFVRQRWWRCTDAPANCAAAVVAQRAAGRTGDE